MIFHIGRLQVLIERHNKMWWKPTYELLVERDPYCQDYWNYLWVWIGYWLCFSLQLTLEKS